MTDHQGEVIKAYFTMHIYSGREYVLDKSVVKVN